jgi:Terpene cyclase DEP1
MRIRNWYVVLCVLGTIIPYSQFIPFLQAHGLNLRLFLEQLFANRIGAFFGLDVIVSSVVLWVSVFADRARGRIRYAWLPLLGNVVVGVSLALPLWLYLREAAPDK